jgi:hypothetical protein
LPPLQYCRHLLDETVQGLILPGCMFKIHLLGYIARKFDAVEAGHHSFIRSNQDKQREKSNAMFLSDLYP